MKLTVIPFITNAFGTIPTTELSEELEDREIRRQVGDHPNNSMISQNSIKIGQIIEKSLRDFTRIAITKALVRRDQVRLVGKNFETVTLKIEFILKCIIINGKCL